MRSVELQDLEKAALRRKEAELKSKAAKEKSLEVKQLEKSILVTSKLYGILKPSGMLLAFYFVAFLSSLLFFLSDKFHFMVRGRQRGVLYDPDIDHFGTPLFLIVTIFLGMHFILLKILIPKISKTTYLKEIDRVKSLPYPVEHYFETIGGDFTQIKLKIHWRTIPDRALLRKIIDGIYFPWKISFHETNDHKSDCISIELGRVSKMNGYLATKAFHELDKIALTLLHKEYGIDRIVFF